MIGLGRTRRLVLGGKAKVERVDYLAAAAVHHRHDLGHARASAASHPRAHAALRRDVHPVVCDRRRLSPPAWPEPHQSTPPRMRRRPKGETCSSKFPQSNSRTQGRDFGLSAFRRRRQITRPGELHTFASKRLLEINFSSAAVPEGVQEWSNCHQSLPNWPQEGQ